MSKTTADSVYNQIRNRILRGFLVPGEQLIEKDLAEQCGVSRTPVREALRQLESEMLVRRTDTKRSYVAEYSMADIDDVFTLRGILEGYAAAWAARNMTERKLGKLRICNDALKKAVANKPAPDVEGFLKNNRGFHNLIIEVAGSQRLKVLLLRLVEQPVVQRTVLSYTREQLMQSYYEHEEILQAFERKDPEWARTIMNGHIRRAFHAYADMFKRVTTPGEDVAAAAENLHFEDDD